ncbi:hypothetical protein PM082_009089 [Marasmius tenuissimus]|nr:hypothetical protein PM082_009089 [Marasmius tenuissimus]
MLRLSKNSGLYPTCLSIQNVKKIGEYPIAAGGFGDVWKGSIGASSMLVCLKVVKVYLKSDLVKLTNEYLREAILWRQLKHPNVLPFFGIYRLEHTQQLCLISPWIEKGNLVEFLKATKREDVDHYTLVYDVTSGLAYLHSRKIVHGDLKGLNILITCSFRACIADFGLSRIIDTNDLQITTSTTRPVETARWLAPELLVGSGGPSKESDVYSYACVCYEIFTGLQPFPELANEMTQRTTSDPVLDSLPFSCVDAPDTFFGAETRLDSDSGPSSNRAKDVSSYPDHLRNIHEAQSQIQYNGSLPTPLETDVEPPEVLSSPTHQAPSYAKPTVPSLEGPNTSVEDKLHTVAGTIETALPRTLQVVIKDFWNSNLNRGRAQEQQDQNPAQEHAHQQREDLDDTSYDPVEPFPNPHPATASALAPLAPSGSLSNGGLSPGVARPPSSHQEMSGSHTSTRKNPNLTHHHNNSSDDSILIPPAMGVLKALDPPHAYQHLPGTGHPHQTHHHHQHTGSTDTTATMQMIVPSRPSTGMERYPSVDSLHIMVEPDIEDDHVRKEIREKGKDSKEGGWLSRWTIGGRDKDKDHGHGQRERSQLWQLVHPEEQGGELTRLIGFLTATSSEDWALVLDVCERASASDSNAKEAVRALRREFKYGAPQAQLSAARLWAIMLRNSTDTFIGQSTSRKFLETLEELLVSSRTNPVVKERVQDVLAAAAYASGSNAKFDVTEKNTGFRGLWKKVKPHDKPDEGMPFDTEDAMFNPPTGGDRRSYSESLHPNHHHTGQQ